MRLIYHPDSESIFVQKVFSSFAIADLGARVDTVAIDVGMGTEAPIALLCSHVEADLIRPWLHEHSQGSRLKLEVYDDVETLR